MRKVLFVTDDLDYRGATTQMALLARGLPPGQVELTVCVLGREGPVGLALRAQGVRIEALGWKHGLDLGPLVRFRRLTATLAPDVFHAWGPSAVRVLALVRGRARPLVVSQPLSGRRAPGRLDRWLLRRADRVVTTGAAEADRCRRLGVPSQKIRVVVPGIETRGRWQGPEGRDRTDPCPLAYTGYVLCIGPLEPHKGFRDAIWAFDVLRRLHPDLHLVLAGSGSDRQRLERFVATIRLGRQIHFVGDQDDLTALLDRAAVVWVPSTADAGRHAALEALAAGRPVVASRLPGLAEVVADGETGLLVPPGDKAALARRTRLLLEDAEHRRQLGEAGREMVRQRFAAGTFVRDFAALYQELAA